MTREKGQALPLVLIVLVVGSLLLVPFLQYASTGLLSSRISSNLLMERCSADAGVEDAMWRLKSNKDGLADSFSPGNPSASYSIIMNGLEVLVDINILQSPPPEPPPEQQPGQHFYIAKSTDTTWIKPNQHSIVTYTISVTNYGTCALHLAEIGDIIPRPFQYVVGSSSGITTDDPVISYEQSRQVLTWSLTGQKPKLDPGETLTQTFQVSTVPARGIYLDEAWAAVAPAVTDPVYTGPTAPVAAGIYDIRAQAGRVVIQARVSVSSTEASILSWQAE